MPKYNILSSYPPHAADRQLQNEVFGLIFGGALLEVF